MRMAKLSISFIAVKSLMLCTLFTFTTVTAQEYTGKLRFVNNTQSYSTAGRLEIYLNGQWGTICQTGFGQDEAILACNQLGYETYQRYGTVGELGYATASTARILVSYLACNTSNPNHLTIYHCPRSSGLSCIHSQDVAMICSTPYSTDDSTAIFVSKREKTSSSLTAGRVNIFFAGRWGTICSDGFTARDAQGLCQIMTGSSDVLAYGTVGSDNLEFDQGSTSTPVWVENFHCIYYSSHSRYFCGHDGIGITNCTHRKDLALSCLADGATRLVADRSPLNKDPGHSAGRLEIYYNSQWGTVCDDQFDSADADIVCKQLGYTRADRYGNVQDLVGYEEGTGRIWLDDVRCNSSDVFLANCSHNGFGNEDCVHREDVAISCSLSEHNLGRLRFVNSTHIFSTSGRLEIYLNGHWGTICSIGFGSEDATLACNQLGYSTYQRYGSVQRLGHEYPEAAATTPILVSSLSCNTSNSSHLTIYHCPRTTQTSCTHNQDVALVCASPYTTTSSAVRFVSKNGSISNSLIAGRVEIFFVGRWGTICSDNFNLSDAMGLCQFLTNSSSVLAYGSTGSDNLEFEQGSSSSPVWIQNMHCMYHTIDGRYYCDWDGLGITKCTHSKDLALSCLADGAVRLLSESPSSTTDPGGSAGRLEVYHNGKWLTVCDAGFNQSEADVVCHQLGYEAAIKYGTVASLGYSGGMGTTWLSNIRCRSGDVTIGSCFRSGFPTMRNCNHSQDVAVSCATKGSNSQTLSTGAIAGIAVGCFVAISVLCIITISLCIMCCCMNSKNSQNIQTSGAALTTAVIDNTHYEASAPILNKRAIDSPQHHLHGREFEMQQQYLDYSNYPQYPPPPNPATCVPGYAADYAQPFEYPVGGEPYKY